MTTLQNLISTLELRYPDTLPPTNCDLAKLRYLQGNREVVEFILQYLTANEEDIERNDILRDS